MNYKIVTTIGPSSWERYARRFAESFRANWPAEATLEIWHHHLNGDVPSFEGVTFRCLDDTPACFPGSDGLCVSWRVRKDLGDRLLSVVVIDAKGFAVFVSPLDGLDGGHSSEEKRKRGRSANELWLARIDAASNQPVRDPKLQQTTLVGTPGSAFVASSEAEETTVPTPVPNRRYVSTPPL